MIENFSYENKNSDLTENNEKEIVYNTKRRAVVGPWKNVSEFNRVYDLIYGPANSPETRRKALSNIQIWSLRRSTSCPAAVLATSVLIELQLKDGPETKFSENELQIFYSSAFTRFFNFMSSIIQSHNMRTMYQTAQELGLQSFVVDLRHICAHGQVLPPLQVLRNTSEYCVSWLHDYYWANQLNTMRDIDTAHIRRADKNEFEANISELFKIYDSALEGHIKGATNLKSLKRHLHGNRFNGLKEFYLKNKLNSLQDIFNVIVQNLCTLVKRDVFIKDMTEIYIEAFLKMKYFFTLSELSDEYLLLLLSGTQTLFRMLAIYGFVEDLFLSLIEITENPIIDSIRRSSAGFWAVKIAEGFSAFRQCKQMYKAELDAGSRVIEAPFLNSDPTKVSEATRELLIYSGVDMKKTIIFADNFRRPWVWAFDRNFMQDRLKAINKYTAPILKSLLPLVEPELNKNEIYALCSVIDCVYGSDSKKEKKTSSKEKVVEIDKIYTHLDLLKTIYKTGDTNMEVEEENNGTTKVSYDEETHDWKSCPLGRLPWE